MTDTTPTEGTERPWEQFERLCAEPDVDDPEAKARPAPPTGSAALMQAQAWICPACHDDHPHPAWLAAHDREVAALALREAADALAEFAVETYPEDVFLGPGEDDYAAINALLLRERGHQLDGVAADCYRRALALAGRLLRERADEAGEADA